MKKFKVLALILTLAMTLNLVAPVAHASEIINDATVQLNNVVTSGDYSISGVENSTVRYNIIINNSDQTGQFAIVYLDSPDYMYEYCFTLNEIAISDPQNIWDDVESYCFSNENNWTEVYLPAAVVSEEVVQNNSAIAQPYATADDVEYFENWLTDKYGDEYSGRLLSTKTQNGTSMYLKSGFQAYAHKDQTYRLAQTLTVVGFVTGVLGLTAGASAVSVIGFIAGTGGMLFLGQSVYKYTVELIGSAMIPLQMERAILMACRTNLFTILVIPIVRRVHVMLMKRLHQPPIFLRLQFLIPIRTSLMLPTRNINRLVGKKVIFEIT